MDLIEFIEACDMKPGAEILEKAAGKIVLIPFFTGMSFPGS
jgi:hypothetical protein